VTRLIFFFASLLASGCVTQQPNPKADLKLIRSYTFELEKQKHLEAPYVAKYQRNGKTLLYLAAKHISAQKYPDLLEHPTLRTIARLFSEYKPQVVIVEGLDTGTEVSPKSIFKKADECEQSKYRSGCGESFFAINQARKIGIGYVSGEPRNSEIKDQLVAEGYTAEDLLGFYLVRQIPQYKRRAEFDRLTFSEQAEKQLARFQKQIGTNLNFGFS